MSLADRHLSHRLAAKYGTGGRLGWQSALAVGKPAGILVHPSGVHYQDTLSNQVAAHYQREGISCPVRPVGRLDKDTSGIVLFAKNQVAAARLSKGEGKLKKEYLCLAKGIFQEKSGWIRTPIRRCADCRAKRTPVPYSADSLRHN